MNIRFDSMSVKQALICFLMILCIYLGYLYRTVQESTASSSNKAKTWIELKSQRDQTYVDNIYGDRRPTSGNDKAVNEQANKATVKRVKTRIVTQPVVFVTILNISLQLFQPVDEIEFPTVKNGDQRIPHIIHQIYNNETLPEIFVGNMKSFVKHNPTWEYRFWSYASGGQLIKERYPYLLQTYNSFSDKVKKADLLRYVLLYEYGGMYADLDVENIRPLNITTTKYSCIIPTEPFEHSGIYYRDGSFIIMTNAILLCKAKHPFYRKILQELRHIADPDVHPVHLTGPGFLSRMFMVYNNFTMYDTIAGNLNTQDKTNSPYFYRGSRNPEDDDGIYVPNTQYFTDNVDVNLVNTDFDMLKDCVNFGAHLPVALLRSCAEFECRKELRRRKTFTFTVHYWKHLWTMPDSYIKLMPSVHIHDVIPGALLYRTV